MGRRSWFTLINKPQMIIHPPAAAAAAIARLVNEALYYGLVITIDSVDEDIFSGLKTPGNISMRCWMHGVVFQSGKNSPFNRSSAQKCDMPLNRLLIVESRDNRDK